MMIHKLHNKPAFGPSGKQPAQTQSGLRWTDEGLVLGRSGLRRMPTEEVQLRLIHLLIGARVGHVDSPTPLQSAQTSLQGVPAITTSPEQDLLIKAFTGSQKKELLQTLLRGSLQSFAARVRLPLPCFC